MNDFNVGDVVILHKPSDTSEYPEWVQQMDKFDGGTFIIKNINLRYLSTCTLFNDEEPDVEDFWFSPSWLSHVDDDEDIFAEEMSLLLD